MPWIRGLIFTLLVPGVVAVVVPYAIDPDREAAGGWWWIGAPMVIAGTAVYSLCLAAFLTSGGTPAVYFTRKLRALIGEEPPRVVTHGLYRVSRNPMYLGVLTVVFGQAVLYRSVPVAMYGVILAVAFHLTVVFIEEPHLRKQRGQSYAEYCRRVPRWLG